MARNRVEPDKRFHYRYLGADLARSAADLLPEGSAEKAGALASAGTWIKNRDSKAAQPFYDALLSCCGDTDLGRKAKRLKSIPTTDVCEGDTKPKAEENQTLITPALFSPGEEETSKTDSAGSPLPDRECGGRGDRIEGSLLR